MLPHALVAEGMVSRLEGCAAFEEKPSEAQRALLVSGQTLAGEARVSFSGWYRGGLEMGC